MISELIYLTIGICVPKTFKLWLSVANLSKSTSLRSISNIYFLSLAFCVFFLLVLLSMFYSFCFVLFLCLILIIFSLSIQSVAMGHMWPRMAMNAAQHKTVNLLKTLWDFLCVIMCHSVFSVWPKTTLLPVWPSNAKRLDTPERPSSRKDKLWRSGAFGNSAGRSWQYCCFYNFNSLNTKCCTGNI